MSSNQSSSSYSYTSTTSSSSSGGESGQSHSHTQTTIASYDDLTGGRAERVTQESGKPTLVESTEVPGRSENSSGRITDVSDAEQAQRDREYEERIEEEYAKREGGA